MGIKIKINAMRSQRAMIALRGDKWKKAVRSLDTVGLHSKGMRRTCGQDTTNTKSNRPRRIFALKSPKSASAVPTRDHKPSPSRVDTPYLQVGENAAGVKSPRINSPTKNTPHKKKNKSTLN